MKHITIAAIFVLALQGLPALSDDISVYINGKYTAIYGPQPRDVDGVMMVPPETCSSGRAGPWCGTIPTRRPSATTGPPT